MGESDRKRKKEKQLQKDNRAILNEMVPVIRELEKKGIKHNDYYNEGLGDVVEATLKQFGITEERFKDWFGLQECGCMGRKKWLNSLFHWHREKK